MSLFLALDAGGTKTRCQVADETRVLAEGSAGTVKIMHVGEEAATGRLQSLVNSVLAQAGVSGKDVTRTAMGIAGISSDVVRTWADRTLRSVVSGDIVLMGDEEIALEAAFEGGPGILVIAGTGSHIAGRCANGRILTAGGWGPVIGDEGSGYWIGLEAIRTALRAHDRGVETCMLHDIRSYWKLASLGDLVAYTNAATRPAFAELTHIVASCAESGDALAAGVLQRAGEELAGSVSLVASKMAANGCAASDAHRIAFTGSVLGKIPLVRKTFTERVQVALPGSAVREEPVEPLAGALWRARRG